MTPDTVHVAIALEDGSTSIMQFVTRQHRSKGDPGWSKEATSDAIESEIAKAGLKAVSWTLIDPRDIPSDRTFRGAWRVDGGRITHCMDRCKAIHRDRMRKARAPILQKLDVEYQRADEAGDTEAKRSIAARKQKLRDCTNDPRIDQAATPEELAVIWPDEIEAPVRVPAPEPMNRYEAIERAINDLPETFPDIPEYQPEDDYLEPNNDPVEMFDPDDAVPVETAGDWRQAISNMEAEPVVQADPPQESRYAVKARVKQAADTAVSNSMTDQIRWEMAVRARNGDAYAIEQFSGEANERGVKVNWLVDEIIAERRAREKKVMRIYQIHARVQAALDIADDVMLADLARDGIAEINKGAENAGANGTGA